MLDRESAASEYRVAAAALRDGIDTSNAAVAEADEVLGFAPDPFLDADVVAAVEVERDAAARELAAATAVLETDAGRLDTAAVRRLTVDTRTAVAEVDAIRTRVVATLTALVASTLDAATRVDTESFDAENRPRIDFDQAVAGLAAGADPVGELADYLVAAHALEASHAEEISEKSGPLLERRLTVQAFARSLSGGVLLDFDWAPTVNGYGSEGTYGGTSYWSAAEGGYATITLSDSVATLWPDPGVQALVVHEVGHAILARADCNNLFFDSEHAPGGEEGWATSWAIGLGHTADGSGESVYGRPPAALIELSKQCR